MLSCLMLCATLWGVPGWATAVGRSLVPVGHTIGIKLFSQGVMVVGLAEVETDRGTATPGLDAGLQVGDVIETANGAAMESSEQFARLMETGQPISVEVNRDGENLTMSVKPVKAKDGIYRLGAWIRDSIAGIGTVTFYDPETGAFGALGHGISDNDTGQLMPMGSGSVMASTVKAVKRGKAGDPGELKGDFCLTEDMGELWGNTEQGVFGVLDGDDAYQGTALEVADRSEVQRGDAVILSNVSGDTVERYTVKILRVSQDRSSQGMLLQVTDPRLLEKTGGIVQGMSGSPIVQNGKLVGAVTHVLLDDPTRGYGIFMEDMLATANELEKQQA